MDILSYLITFKSPKNMVKWKFEIPPPPPDHSPLKGFANFWGIQGSTLELISALERRDDAGHNVLSQKLYIIREHDEPRIKLFVFSPDNWPRRHYLAFFSRSQKSISEMISALERGDNGGHFKLSQKLRISQEHGQMEIPPSPRNSPTRKFSNVYNSRSHA